MQHPGVLGTLIDAQQKIADTSEKAWKKLPGIKDKDRTCQLHLEVSPHLLFAFFAPAYMNC